MILQPPSPSDGCWYLLIAQALSAFFTSSSGMCGAREASFPLWLHPHSRNGCWQCHVKVPSNLPLLGSVAMKKGKQDAFSRGLLLLPLLQSRLQCESCSPTLPTATKLTGVSVGTKLYLWQLLLSFSTSPTHSNLPTIRCSNVLIIQAYLCVEQVIFYTIIVVQYI